MHEETRWVECDQTNEYAIVSEDSLLAHVRIKQHDAVSLEAIR